MLGHQVGVHFDMRKLVGMSLEMNLEIAFGGEPIKKLSFSLNNSTKIWYAICKRNEMSIFNGHGPRIMILKYDRHQ